VHPEVKASRLEFISRLQCGISEERNRHLVDKTVEVLVEGTNKKDNSLLSGRTRTNKPVVFKGSRPLIGKLVSIEVESVTPYALRGRIAG
jgi:tRNA-2-methylthio-N6-dimethylallyladenosine synthase